MRTANRFKSRADSAVKAIEDFYKYLIDTGRTLPKKSVERLMPVFGQFVVAPDERTRNLAVEINMHLEKMLPVDNGLY